MRSSSRAVLSLFLLAVVASTIAGQAVSSGARGLDANSTAPPISYSNGQGVQASYVVSPAAATVSTAQAAYNPVGDFANGGAFTYNYPLNLPVGTHGMGPSLGIFYSSNLPNDLLGVGFLLNGLSKIERDSMFAINFTASDRYVLDGEKLFYSSTEKAFHPQRESFDRIEAFSSASNPTATDGVNTTSSYWRISKRDGTKLYFGSTQDSRIPAEGKGGLPRVWALNKVIDSEGNFYTISYTTIAGTGAFYPDKIVYTQNDSSTSSSPTLFKAVKFTYEQRSDRGTVYAPTLVTQTQRLKEISVALGTDVNGVGGSLVRKYRLAYQTSPTSGRSQLISIQEEGNDGTALPPTRFSWPVAGGAPGVGLLTASHTDNGEGANLIPGDFDGDGKTDFLRQEVGSQSGDNVTTLQIWPSTVGHYVTISDAAQHNGDSINIIPGDYDGDGKLDFLRQEKGGQANDNIATLQVLLSGTNGGFTWKTVNDNGYEMRGEQTIIIPGDFNGDGKTDFIRQEQNTNANDDSRTLEVYLAIGAGNFSGPILINPNGYEMRGEQTNIIPGDFDGDGKTDFIRQEKSTNANDNARTLEVYLATGGGAFNGPILINPNGYEMRGEFVNIIVGDYNGDGKADFLRQEKGSTATDNSRTLEIYLATGEGHFTGNISVDESSSKSGENATIITGDFNGDGRTDFFAQTHGGNSSNPPFETPQLYTSSGDGKFSVSTVSSPHNLNGYIARIVAGDFNGDGWTDFLRQEQGYGSYDDNLTLSQYTAQAAPDVVRTITLPSGGTVTATYTPAPQVTGAIVPSAFDLANNIIPNSSSRLLVTQVIVSDGVAGSTPQNTTYEYANGRRMTGYRADQTDLGFKTLKVWDALGNSTVSEYRQDLPFQGRKTKETVYGPPANGPGLPYRQIVTTLATNRNSTLPAVHFVYASQIDVNDFDGLSNTSCVTTRKTFEYDALGRLRKTVDWGYVGTSNTPVDPYARREESLFYSQNSQSNLSVLTSRRGFAYNSAGLWTLDGQTEYLFDDNSLGSNPEGQLLSRGRLKAVVAKTDATDLAKQTVTTMEYDDWGNLTKSWDARFNSGELVGLTKPTTETGYDVNYHALPVSKTNRKSDAEEFVTTTQYDTLMRPWIVTDPNGMTTTMAYDGFGRISSTTVSPDTSLRTTMTEYSDVANSTVFPRYVKSSVLTKGAEYLDSYRYLDGLGRTIQTMREDAVAGKWTTQDWSYDASGRNDKVSVPHLANTSAYSAMSTSAWNSLPKTLFRSDPLGRVVQTTNPDGTTKRVFYQLNITWSLDENGHLKSLEDNINSVVSRTYSGQFPSYIPSSAASVVYSAITTEKFAGLTQTTDSGGKLTKEYFDLLGRRTKLVTPDIGAGKSWDYTYDANGNLKTQTDPNGKVITFLYDALDRLTEKAYSDSTPPVHYTYDLGANGKGHVSSVSFARGSDSFSYDIRGRTISQTRTVDGMSRTRGATYDSMDRTDTETLPTGKTLTYSYGPDGNLTKIHGDQSNTDYVSNLTYNALNKVTAMNYGNGIATAYDYYDAVSETDPTSGKTYSFRLKGIAAGPGGVVMNTGYSYDLADNVKRKVDLNNGDKTQTYDYDALDRLTASSSMSYGASSNLSWSPNEINNLTYKDDHALSYDFIRAHLVETWGSLIYSYDANGNLVGRSDGQSFTYDAENRLTAVKNGDVQIASHSYDANRQRVTKTVGTKTTVYWFGDYEEDFDTSALGTPTAVPPYPNNSAGTVYSQDAWATVSGWNNWATGGGTLTTPSGVLRVTKDTQPWVALRKQIALTPNTQISLRVRGSKNLPNSSIQYYNGSAYVPIATIPLTTSWATYTVTLPAATSYLLIRTTNTLVSGDWMELDWIYMGDGSEVPTNPESLPNAPEGASYLGSGWATQDNWVTGINGDAGAGSVSISNGKLVADGKTYFDRYDWNYLPLTKGRVVALRGRVTRGSSASLRVDLFSTTGYLKGQSIGTLGTEWKTLCVEITDPNAVKLSCIYSSDYKTVDRRIEIDWIYVGSGSIENPGKSYYQDSWTTPDGWLPQDNGPALVVSDGTLTVGATGSLGRYMSVADKGITMRVRTRDNTTRDAYWTAWNVQSLTNTTSTHFTITGTWSIVTASFASVVSGQNLLQIYQNNIEIDFISIGVNEVSPTVYPVNPNAQVSYFKKDFTAVMPWQGFENPVMLSGTVSIVDGDIVTPVSTNGGLRLWQTAPAGSVVVARVKSDVATTLSVDNDSSGFTVNLQAGVWTTVKGSFATASPFIDFNYPTVACTLSVDSIYIGDGTSVPNLVDYRSSILANGQRIVQVGPVGATYYHQDHLGSVIATTDDLGNKTVQASYKPYGNMVNSTGVKDGRLYTDQLWDADAGLYYYNARYYDAELGRFTQPDPALWDGQYYGKVPLTLEEQVNPYLYAMNNPVKYTDPTGLWEFSATAAWGPALSVYMASGNDKFSFGFDVGVGAGGELALDLSPNNPNDLGSKNTMGVKATGKAELGGKEIGLKATQSRDILTGKVEEAAEASYASPYGQAVTIGTSGASTAPDGGLSGSASAAVTVTVGTRTTVSQSTLSDIGKSIGDGLSNLWNSIFKPEPTKQHTDATSY